jgi:hypothetical protein
MRAVMTGAIRDVVARDWPAVRERKDAHEPVNRSTSRYNRCVITRGILEFVARDWPAVRESKDAYWAARIARLGPLEALQVGDALRQQARQLVPSWPDDVSRQDDLAAHVRLAERFRRADPARRA